MLVRRFLPACVVLAVAVALSPHVAAQAGAPLVRSIAQFIERRSDCRRHRHHRGAAARDDVRRRWDVHLRQRAARARITCRCARRAIRRAAPRCRVGAGATAARRARRSRAALRGSAVGQRRRAQPVRGVPADVGAGGAGAGEAARDVARRDAREPARRRVAELRAGAGASGHSRPRRRSRADPAGRPAHRRSVESVRRSRRADQSGRGAADRGRARSGDAALRRQRDRRPGQRHHRRDPDQAADGRQRQLHVRSGYRRRTKAAAAATCTSATARSRCTSAAAAVDRATSARRRATS